MTTTDSKGIVFLEETDIISPFHTLMNVLQQGTTDAFDDVTNLIDSKITILHRDTIAERDALTASTSTDNPLFVYVKETGLLYLSDDGATWNPVASREGTAYLASRSNTTTHASATWVNSLNLVLPADSPAGQYLLDLSFTYSGNAANGVLSVKVCNGPLQTDATIAGTTQALNAQSGISASAGSPALYTHTGGAKTLSVWASCTGALALGPASLRADWRGPVA